MFLKGYFPAEFRAFCLGRTSVCVERYGGITELSRLEVRESHGKLYPDQYGIRILTRASVSGEMLFSPAQSFFRISPDGCEQNLCPCDMELYPFGFRSAKYEMRVGQDHLAFAFPGPASGKFRVRISRNHCGEGKRKSTMNQIIYAYMAHARRTKEQMCAEGVDPDFPFSEKELQITCKEFGFHPETNLFVLVFRLEYETFSKELYAVFAANCHFEYERKGEFAELTAECASRVHPICGWGFGDAFEEAADCARSVVENYDIDWKLLLEKFERFRTPSLEIEGLSKAAEFIREVPLYQRTMVLAETEDQAAIRAAAHKFGFFAIWDHIYPIRDFLWFGDTVTAGKALRYSLDYPHTEVYVWVTVHLIVAFNEYLAFVDMHELLAKLLPFLKHNFLEALKHSDPEKGLLITRYCCGNDNSQQAGFEKPFFASCINGWWYDACRALENMAFESNDFELETRCRETADKIEKNYMPVFFSEEDGYLYQAVYPDGSIPVRIFQNTNSLALDYGFGEYLLRNRMDSLATYQATLLYHTTGHRAVASDSPIPCDMWRGVHMNQHLGHESRLARYGGRPGEARRLAARYLEVFDRCKVAVETFNFTGCSGNETQKADWQTFSATGAAQMLWHGVCGVEWHRGGLLYVPAMDSGKIRIGNFSMRGCFFDIELDGKGSFAFLTIDGVPIPGTLQIPVDTIRDGEKHFISIQRCGKPEHPVLLDVPDMPISRVECMDNILEFRMDDGKRTPLKIYSPSRPVLSVNGKTIPFEWNGEKQTLRLDMRFRPGDIVRVKGE